MKKIKTYSYTYIWYYILSIATLLAVVFYFENLWTTDNSIIARNYALILGGFIGLFLAIKRTIVADKQHKLAERGQITERFSLAVEQLDKEKNVSTRIGGLYALEQITKDIETYTPLVQNVIANFIRRPPYDIIEITERTEELPEARDCPDLHVAIEVFQKLKCDKFPKSEIKGSILTCLDLSNIDIKGLNFDNSKFDGSKIKYSKIENCEFRNCRFIKSDISHTKIKNSDFNNSYLLNTHFNFSNISSSLFQQTQFHNCDLSFSNFNDSTITYMSLKGTNISSCDFKNAYQLFQEQFDEAWAWSMNIPSLPTGFKVPLCPVSYLQDNEHNHTPPAEWYQTIN